MAEHRIVQSVALVLLLLLSAPAISRAGEIDLTFTDVNEAGATLTAIQNGVMIGDVFCAGEMCTWDLENLEPAADFPEDALVAGLEEPGNAFPTVFSDLVFYASDHHDKLDAMGNPVTDFDASGKEFVVQQADIHFTFTSDPDDSIGVRPVLQQPIEDGTVQNLDVFFESINRPFQAPGLTAAAVHVFVQSDVDPVPEPSTFALAAGGLLLLVVRRKRGAQGPRETR